jgi:hypothetical protein
MAIVKSLNWRMSQDEWDELTRVAKRLDRTPIDTVRKLVREASKYVAEEAVYVATDSDIIQGAMS